MIHEKGWTTIRACAITSGLLVATCFLLGLSGSARALDAQVFGGPLITFHYDAYGNDDLTLMDYHTFRRYRLSIRQRSDERNPTWSPDGWSIAYQASRGPRSDIYTASAAGIDRRNLTQSRRSSEVQPAWSPNGRWIAYISDRKGKRDLWLMRSDGSKKLQITRINRGAVAWPSWSPDSTTIAYRSTETGDAEVFTLKLNGRRIVNRTKSPDSDETTPTWSPGGQYLVFSSDKTGKSDLYTKNLYANDWSNLTNSPRASDSHPSWSPNGRRLAFERRDGRSSDIYLVNTDGSGEVNLSRSTANELSPTWRPNTLLDAVPPESQARVMRSRASLDVQVAATDGPQGSGVAAVMISVVGKRKGNVRCPAVTKRGIRNVSCDSPEQLQARFYRSTKQGSQFQVRLKRSTLKKLERKKIQIRSVAIDRAGNREILKSQTNLLSFDVKQ